ncbi:hypothetical protein AWC38_SpisGene18298 [Stylophora pistillata]|uniref:DDE Tnp4 domain-containing protein n=1 Tax=Stylophora pistillata TaxID=50429 RepID=A0A2B4RJM7_STYPI|nr:hypothetical protein AWC38_SpisGene18298 [Stylophora pistillata]
MAAMAGESTTASSGSSTSTGKQDKGKGWHWNCAATLCTNNWRNKDLTYYTLSRIGSSTDSALRASYMKVLKNDDINWKKAVICCQHWSKGKRENLYALLDRVCNEQYVQNLKKSASKCAKLKSKKLVAAKRLLEFSSREVKSKRRIIVKKEREKDKEITPVLNKASRKDESQYRLENEILRNQCEELASKLKEKDKEMERLKCQEFYDAGYVETEALGDATETWITHDTYPGTISDKDITEQCEVLDKVNKGKIILTDKGFDIADLCHHKGLLHNRPLLKFDSQYEQTDISKNFDIATLRIYSENFIGRMRLDHLEYLLAHESN